MRALPIGIPEKREENDDLSDLAQVYHTRDGMRELQGEALPLVLIGIAAVALYLLQFYFPYSEPQGWVSLWSLLAVLSVVYYVRERHALASHLLASALFVLISALVCFYPGTTVATLFSLVVLIAGVLLGSRESLAIAAVSSIFLAVAAWYWNIVSSEILVTSGFLIWGVAYLSWLSTRPLRTALDWSWSSYVQALQRTKELRKRQGELVALTKGLAEAYSRLEHLNAELEQARRAAETARKQKSEFAATISHELRTPLNLIVGFSEMMVVRPDDSYGESLPESYRGDIEAIYRSACHISTLIDDVLDLSQIEAHRMALHKEMASLADVINEAVSTVHSLFADKGLSLSVEVAPDLPNIWFDRARIRQILINLLANAARFTNSGGATVRARLEPHDVVLSVADTGIGMKQEDVASVFREFHQVGSGGRDGRNSGLGLAISRRFAELHGGRMWVESEPGKGSTFSVALPLTDAPPILPRIRTGPAVGIDAADAQRTVVVVDQGTKAFGIVRRYLDDYQVVRAEKPSQALHAVDRSSRFAILLADARGENGWQELQQFDGTFGSVPVVTCPLRTTADLSRELGVTDYLVKPITREQLQSSLALLPRKPRRILVVDDDPEMVRLMGRLLRSQGKRIRVFSAHNGVEGLRLAREKRPDVIILDLLMPEVNGYDVIETVRSDEELKRIPVIVVSAKGQNEESVLARMVGITRPSGLTVGEAMRCVKSSLDVLFSAPAAISPEQLPDAAQ